ncbi:universal stress protein [Bacillota bacterium]
MKTINSILVPIDGSKHAERALLKAKELADCLGSKIILLNIVNMFGAESYTVFRSHDIASILNIPELIKKADIKSVELLEHSKQLLGALNVETVSVHDPAGKPAEVIVHFAKEHDVDLIVMGSNGVGSLSDRLYIGSVTMKVLHTTEKPVLVIQ